MKVELLQSVWCMVLMTFSYPVIKILICRARNQHENLWSDEAPSSNSEPLVLKRKTSFNKNPIDCRWINIQHKDAKVGVRYIKDWKREGERERLSYWGIFFENEEQSLCIPCQLLWCKIIHEYFMMFNSTRSSSTVFPPLQSVAKVNANANTTLCSSYCGEADARRIATGMALF